MIEDDGLLLINSSEDVSWVADVPRCRICKLRFRNFSFLSVTSQKDDKQWVPLSPEDIIRGPGAQP